MNLRGMFTTDEGGRISFRTVKPAGYPIPLSGPVGALLRMQGRHNLRPAHVHFMIHKPGFKTQFSQVYASDDPNLETDVQFAVTRKLVGQFVRHDDGPRPRPTFRAPGTRWTTSSRSSRASRGCRSRRSPARREAIGPRSRFSSGAEHSGPAGSGALHRRGSSQRNWHLADREENG